MKIIFKNLFSLGLVQGVNLLVPLLVTPYLIKTIGVNSFGVIATAQSLIVFFNLFTDFGFNLTSVRRIAQAQGNKKEIEAVINGVVFLKLLLLGVSFILFVILIFITPQFNKHFIIYLYSFSMVVGQAFLPLWFYQGTENLNKTIIPVVVFKILTIVFIYLFIKTQTNSAFVNFIFGTGNILTGLYLFRLIRKEYTISVKHVNLSVLKTEFHSGIAMFISNIGVVIYANSSLLILSFFLTPASLGIYSVVDKIIQILKGLLALVHQVMYPRVCNIVQESESTLFDFIKKIYGAVWFIVLMVCLFLFFYPNIIVSYFIKDAHAALFATEVLRYFSFILFIVSLNMPFYQSLLAYRKDWLTVRILFAGAIVSVILNILLVPLFKIQGAAISMYIVETLVTLTLMYFMFQLKKTNEQRKLFK